MKPYRGINFLHQHFLSVAHLDATELFQSLMFEEFSPGATTRGTIARYLQLRYWEMRLQKSDCRQTNSR